MLLWQARRGTSYSINNLNEYTLVGGHAASYDNNGNVLSRYDASGTQWTYTYDAMNRLTNATNGATTRNFYYDGLNRQIARSGTALPATYSLWDGWDLYAEYGYKAAVDSPIRTTIHGAPGDLIQQNKSGFTNTNYYPDGLGSTAYLASGAGAMLEQYTYDAYGTPTIYNASGTIIGASAYAADHFFTGRQWHAALGLYDNRHRFYAPDWGRFLQPDPIGFAGDPAKSLQSNAFHRFDPDIVGDPANLYRYCHNNPTTKSDPFGLGDSPYGTMFYNGPQDNEYWSAQAAIQRTAQKGAIIQTVMLGNDFIGAYNFAIDVVNGPGFRFDFGVVEVAHGKELISEGFVLEAIPSGWTDVLALGAFGLGIDSITDGMEDIQAATNGEGFNHFTHAEPLNPDDYVTFDDLSVQPSFTPGDIAPAGIMGQPSPLETAVTKVIQP